jgi:hypothetical protein
MEAEQSESETEQSPSKDARATRALDQLKWSITLPNVTHDRHFPE